jgi:hypothetical protein
MVYYSIRILLLKKTKEAQRTLRICTAHFKGWLVNVDCIV